MLVSGIAQSGQNLALSRLAISEFIKRVGERDKMRGLYKMRGLTSILSLSRNEFNTFNNTRARMLDSIYHMALR